MIFLETQILGKDQNGVRTFSVHVLQSYKPEKGKLGTGNYGAKCGPKLDRLVYKQVTFSETKWYNLYGSLSNSQWHVCTKAKLENP